MPQLTESTFTVKGKSKKEYKFEVYSLDTHFNSVGGIYIFSERVKDASDNFSHKMKYCGKTEDLSTRFNNHHKSDCTKKNGANCIGIKSVSTEKERTEIETDILLGNNFTCNEVLN